MTQSNDIAARVAQLENSDIELRMAVSALIATAQQHQLSHEASQRNFERIQLNIEAIQTEIRGLQLENKRILDHLFGESEQE